MSDHQTQALRMSKKFHPYAIKIKNLNKKERGEKVHPVLSRNSAWVWPLRITQKESDGASDCHHENETMYFSVFQLQKLENIGSQRYPSQWGNVTVRSHTTQIFSSMQFILLGPAPSRCSVKVFGNWLLPAKTETHSPTWSKKPQ